MAELRAHSVNQRFRVELARRGIRSEAEAARQAQVKQQWLSRRLTGSKPWTLVELESVCMSLGLSFKYVATGEPLKAVGAANNSEAWREGWEPENWEGVVDEPSGLIEKPGVDRRKHSN
jgi:hypothetical protein